MEPTKSIQTSNYLDIKIHRLGGRKYLAEKEKQISKIKKINEKIDWGKYNSSSLTLRRLAKDKIPYFVATSNGKVAGYVVIEDKDGEGYIPYIAINPKFQGKGIGRKLMEKAFYAAKKAGLHSVWLEYRDKEGGPGKFYTEKVVKDAGAFKTEAKRTYINGDKKTRITYNLDKIDIPDKKKKN